MIIITIILILLDAISKMIISNNLTLNKSITIIPNFFYLTYAHNYGGAWSICENSTLIITIVSFIVILGISYYIFKNKVTKKIEVIGYSLLLGGAIGNLIDRVMYGYVIDFFDFYIFGYDFPVFNIADIGIITGIILLAISMILEAKKNDNKCNR